MVEPCSDDLGGHLPASQKLEMPPLQQPLLPSAPPHGPPHVEASQPWDVGPQNVYDMVEDLSTPQQALYFPLPDARVQMPRQDATAWQNERREILREWGQKRERAMHRPPRCLMDQMVSGSGYYPIRLLEDTWLTPEELIMVQRLEQLLEGTKHAHSLARDMLTPVVFGVDVRIILDNSGSMDADMFGNFIPAQSTWNAFNNFASTPEIEALNPWNEFLLEQTLRSSFPQGWFADPNLLNGLTPARGGPSPFHSRWWFARDAIQHWMQVYRILGMDPWVYLLNSVSSLGHRCRGSQVEQVFSRPPSGSTAMTEAFERVLSDHRCECPGQPLLLLALTDGEANNMTTFNQRLDEIQNLKYGDVQVCLMGLSLVKEDIEWFENEECDETRIRTVEAFEVENRQIQLREVVRREGGYNFLMHTYRVLVTNFFPADYDYEAPLQNMRHRLYITLHGRDRWWSIQIPGWSCISQPACACCFLATGAHCCGWCQGNDCGKWQLPDLLGE